MAMLTVRQAAQATGWSPRMLRYVETLGLVEPGRSAGGYRLYGAVDLQRLRTLRELLDTHNLTPGDVGLVLRMRREPELAHALDRWLDGPADEWLAWEQAKHEQLLSS